MAFEISSSGISAPQEGAAITAPSLSEAAERTNRNSGWLDVFLFIPIITATFAALAFHSLALKTIWFDEGASVGIARLDWPGFIQILWRREANMSLYYLALGAWLHFGNSPYFIRALSVLFALATVPAIYFLGRRLFNSWVGLIASFLFAFNAFELSFAQQARSYSLMVALCTWSSLFFVEYLENPSSRNRDLYIAASVLAVYAHFFSGLLIAAQWLWLRLRDQTRSRLELRRLYLWVLVFSSPLLIFIFKTGAGPLRWVVRPGWRELWKLALCLCGNGGPMLILVYSAACVAILIARNSDEIRTWNVRLLWLWLFGPVATIFVVSQARPLFVNRYFAFCLPALCLLAAAGISRIPSKAGVVAALAVFGALSLRGDARYYQRDFDLDRENWRAATQYLQVNARPEDALLFHIAMARFPYEYYRSLAGPDSSSPEVVYPNDGPRLTAAALLDRPNYAQIAQKLSRHPRVWLVVSQNGPRGMDATASRLAGLAGSGRTLDRELNFDAGLRISLYGPPNAR